MLRWGAAAYALLGIFALVVAELLRGESPLLHPEPWLGGLEPNARHLYSALCGVAFGALVVVCTRAVGKFGWARRLHLALRPVARGLSPTAIVILAGLSAFGEELLFRGLLGPLIGVLPQALLFGLAHQMAGPSRWVWVAWATAVGLALGAMYQLTGSLVGPVLSHALINALNLSYLKRHDPAPRAALGGLLGQEPHP